MNRPVRWRRILIAIVILLTFVQRSTPTIITFTDKLRVYTSSTEYDYANWTVDALFVKANQAATQIANYLSVSEQRKAVFDYIDLVRQMDQLQAQISQIYADPTVKHPELTAKNLLSQQSKLESQREILGPIAESVIQRQVGEAIKQLGLSFIGQPLPPVLYRVTPLPLDLVVSPRNAIQQDAAISLDPTLSLSAITSLENNVEKNLGVSALVVPVGGIGNYPTMVESSSDLEWNIEVVSHEWTHNYLEFHPLGLSYDNSPELRTMNETTANISGKEIALAVLKKFYPELVPPPQPAPANNSQPSQPAPATPPAFSFQSEMHKTRVQTDLLLSQGKIAEAETYMETERQILWSHGYQIRRLNQAYFAFYGAYADVPGGAQGTDPVGPAVNLLREQSSSLADFIHRVAAMSTFQQLEDAIK